MSYERHYVTLLRLMAQQHFMTLPLFEVRPGLRAVERLA